MKNLNAEFLLYTGENRTHEMKLHPAAFEAIKEGRKNVEMRLNDEKRRFIRRADHIRFVNEKRARSSLQRLLAGKCIRAFLSFIPGTINYPLDIKKTSLNPWDMLEYYTEESIEKYGAFALVIELI